MKAIISSVYPYILLSFCFVLPMDKYATALPNIFLIALLITFPFVVRRSDFKKLFKREILIYTGLVLYVTINNLLFHDFQEDKIIISKIASSLLLIVLFIPIDNPRDLMKTLVGSVLVCILISLYHLYFFYMKQGEFNFASGSVINDVLIIDRLYLGFLCVLSIISSIALIGDKYNDYNKWYFANIVICAGFVLLISSRIAIVLLLILFFLKIFYAKRKFEYLFFFIGIISIVLVAFMMNKNLSQRFFYTHSTQKQKSYIELFQQWEPRFVIWGCDFDIMQKEEFLINGLGYYETKDKLVNCYQETVFPERRKIYFMESRFNSHNQFIDFMMGSGIISAILFLWIYLSFFYRNWRRFFPTALLLAMFLFTIIESIFHRQLGGYLFGIIIIFLLMETNSNKTIAKNNHREIYRLK